VVGRVFNIATGHQATLNQTISILRRITGYQGPVQHGPERTGDIKHSFADISRAQKHLGYRSVVGFEEGLQRTVAWYQEQASPVAAQASERGR
jgi:UDP-glucose 4-epimerase